MLYLLAAFVLCLGNFFLHKPISDVCDAVLARVGFVLYDRGALLTLAVLSVLAAAPIAARRRQALADPVTFAVLLALAVISVAAQHWLLVTNIELIHFPQFALIAGLLYAGGLSPLGAWLGATAAGIVDEIYQHLVIYAARTDVYLDFNDMVLNAIGAAWIIVLAASAVASPEAEGGRHPRSSLSGPRRRRLAAGLLAALLVAFWIDPPRLHPVLTLAPTGREYRVLSLPEGLLAAVLVWALVAAAVGPRRRADID